MYAVMVTGKVMNVFMTPQILGTGKGEKGCCWSSSSSICTILPHSTTAHRVSCMYCSREEHYQTATYQKNFGALTSSRVFFFCCVFAGSNLVCTALYHQLMELSNDWNQPLGDVVLQMDNTVAENKNNIVTGMSAALIDSGVVRTISLVFSMVGHTHNELDQAFSW